MTGTTNTGVALVALDRSPDELPVHVVGNGVLDLAFLPTVGGRLISLRYRGTELLWSNPRILDAALRTVTPRSRWEPLTEAMSSWANVGGSKTWPAPQGWSGPEQWAGPPDPVLDSGCWDLTATESDRGLIVLLRSPDDPRTGLRIVRQITVAAGAATFHQRSTLTNVSARTIRWSAWEVCQVDTAQFTAASPATAGIRVAVAGTDRPLSLLEPYGRIAVGDVVGGMRHVPVDDVVAKAGFTDSTGVLEFERPDGAGITWRFDVPQGEYPDGGCQVQLWMQSPTPEPLDALGGLHPDARLVELEVLSPLTVLVPGDSVSLDIEWEVRGPAAGEAKSGTCVEPSLPQAV